ncbi:MAG: CDGSH iron-sulfur domain-containing protein [Acidiferrobacterales bacterium]
MGPTRYGLWFIGDIEINGIEGESRDFRVALCRCGASKYKPFCDGSHEKLSFNDNGKGKAGIIEDNLAEGELTTNPATDGPLLLSGPVEIRNAEGKVIFRGEKTSLCRCGASSNKPFCDGSHMGINFKAG